LEWQPTKKRTGLGSGETSEASSEVVGKELLDLRTQPEDARFSHTEDYPDLVSLKQKIGEREELL